MTMRMNFEFRSSSTNDNSSANDTGAGAGAGAAALVRHWCPHPIGVDCGDAVRSKDDGPEYVFCKEMQKWRLPTPAYPHLPPPAISYFFG